MTHVLKCCVKELVLVMDRCCALQFYCLVPWRPKNQITDTSGFGYVKF